MACKLHARASANTGCLVSLKLLTNVSAMTNAASHAFITLYVLALIVVVRLCNCYIYRALQWWTRHAGCWWSGTGTAAPTTTTATSGR
jgi:hypothetical protein